MVISTSAIDSPAPLGSCAAISGSGVAFWSAPVKKTRSSGRRRTRSAAEAAAEASLIEDEAHLIGSIIELGDTIVREVMVLDRHGDLEAHLTVNEALAVVVDTGFTRLPVVGDTVDDVLGLVLSKDLVAAQLRNPHDTDMRGLHEKQCSFLNPNE